MSTPTHDTVHVLLEETKLRHGLRTDAELAQRFGVTAMVIHRLRTMDEIGPTARLLVRLIAEQREQIAA